MSQKRPPIAECLICTRSVFSSNYGVNSCNACKMFFLRITKLNTSYTCKYYNNCSTSISPIDPKPICRACRYRKCLDVGMAFGSPTNSEVVVRDDVANLVRRLIQMDASRNKTLLEKSTDVDPSLDQVILGEGLHLGPRNPVDRLSCKRWSLFEMLTSVQFFLNLDFMSQLDFNDKRILLLNFCDKASFAFSSMRSVQSKSHRLIHPDGSDVFCNETQKSCRASDALLSRIRCSLVGKIIEVRATNEELLLLLVVLFCDAGHENLSEHGKELVEARRNAVCSALLKYCHVAYQQSGPSRFSELLSLSHVICKISEDVRSLVTLLRIYKQDDKCCQLLRNLLF